MFVRRFVSIVLAALIAASCTEQPSDSGQRPSGELQAGQSVAPPYRPIATNLELMESLIAHAAEEYWGAVRIIIDANGVTKHFPETDEDWEEVWAAGISLAESGNLLMMPPRGIDAEWNRISAKLIDVGVDAAAAALTRDPDAVLEAGERVYNVCLECHDRYLLN